MNDFEDISEIRKSILLYIRNHYFEYGTYPSQINIASYFDKHFQDIHRTFEYFERKGLIERNSSYAGGYRIIKGYKFSYLHFCVQRNREYSFSFWLNYFKCKDLLNTNFNLFK